MKWIQLGLDAQPRIRPFFKFLRSPLADINLEMMMSWRHALRLRYSISGNYLGFLAHFEGEDVLWGPPIGERPTIADVIKFVRSCQEAGGKPKILYLWDDYQAFPDLSTSSRFCISPQALEYRYRVERIANLSGRRLRKKRASVRKLKQLAGPRTEPFRDRHRGECLSLLDWWISYKERRVSGEVREKMLMESQVCANALRECEALDGVVVYVSDRLVAFSLGSWHAQGVFNCMFEKANITIAGLSAFVFQALAKHLLPTYSEINAGEDWNVDYLREAKQSWQPSSVVPSYTASLSP